MYCECWNCQRAKKDEELERYKKTPQPGYFWVAKRRDEYWDEKGRYFTKKQSRAKRYKTAYRCEADNLGGFRAVKVKERTK